MGVLPSVDGVAKQCHVTLTEDGQSWVLFNLRMIPGDTYTRMLDEARERNDGGDVTTEDIAVDMIALGVVSIISSEVNAPQVLDADEQKAMAVEVWTTWPSWARRKLTDDIRQLATEGHGPKASPGNGPGGT